MIPHPTALYPAERWQQDARRHGPEPGGDSLARLRLAAMAGHMAGDRLAARRAALIDLLADGRPHVAEEIRCHVAAVLGYDPWGGRPNESLLRDVAALRRGGLRLAYSRRRGLSGYYLLYPPLGEPARAFGGPDAVWVERLRAMSVIEKNETAFAAADFALRQKRLILSEERPDWPAAAIDREARRLVYGVRPPDGNMTRRKPSAG